MMERFPVRTGPTVPVQFRQRFKMGEHEGTDIFAPAGAEAVAVADGQVRQAKEGRGGFVVYLTEPDGTQYFYGHLDAFVNPMMPGSVRQVEAGDPIGYVGTSGNAKGAPPHIHFEYRPRGGSKRDPFPQLARLAEEEEVRVTKAKKENKPKKKRPKETRRPSKPRKSKRNWGALVFLYILARSAG